LSKIFHNIEETDYIFETENFEFHFSSMLYLVKFKERYKENREKLLYKLSSRYNIEFVANDYFDFILYSSIEKRGFKVVCKKKGEIFRCLKDIILDGEIKTSKN